MPARSSRWERGVFAGAMRYARKLRSGQRARCAATGHRRPPATARRQPLMMASARRRQFDNAGLADGCYAWLQLISAQALRFQASWTQPYSSGSLGLSITAAGVSGTLARGIAPVGDAPSSSPPLGAVQLGTTTKALRAFDQEFRGDRRRQ